MAYETIVMPEKKIQERARKAGEAGKSPSTQAGEYVREEMKSLSKGNRRVRSRKQAIAVGLSKARRAGVDLPPPQKGKTSAATRRKALRDVEKGRMHGTPSARGVSKRENAGQAPVSRKKLSARSRAALSRRTRAQRLGTASRVKARFSAAKR